MGGTGGGLCMSMRARVRARGRRGVCAAQVSLKVGIAEPILLPTRLVVEDQPVASTWVQVLSRGACFRFGLDPRKKQEQQVGLSSSPPLWSTNRSVNSVVRTVGRRLALRIASFSAIAAASTALIGCLMPVGGVWARCYSLLTTNSLLSSGE